MLGVADCRDLIAGIETGAGVCRGIDARVEVGTSSLFA